MFRLLVQARRSTLPVLIVLCLAALTVSYAYAEGGLRPLATQIIGDPDAAVTGKLAVGTATPGNKALTVVGVIDFLGAGTVHNYFTQGGGNNMQINANVDEANTVGDATKSQWKLVLGSSLDWFSIRRSPVGGTYNEDALLFIQGSTGRVGIATVDTGNGASIPFSPAAKLHVHAPLGSGISSYGTVGTTGSGSPGYDVGVLGEASAPGADGVYGMATAASGAAWGVHGWSASDSGIGVQGFAAHGTGITYGVEGEALSPSGTGVGGYALATSGTTYGVYGESSSPDGVGVFGYGESTTGYNYGVIGSTSSPAGNGVSGYAPLSGIAVYGSNASTLGWAGYFVGDLGTTGNLYVSGSVFKGGGGFRIDHPLDPGGKYLYHSFVESPDMKNIYDGVVTLDENGEAWVQLPDWFEALNEDFRYQLTPVGAAMPDLHIAQGIQDNRFQIAGGVAESQVSWQVTGIRHDSYAEDNRISVEEDKEAGRLSSAESLAAPQALTGPAPEPPGGNKQ